MANVFIFSMDDAEANFGIAIKKGLRLETLLPFIRDEIQAEHLRRFYLDGKCYILGVQERGDNLSTWNIMAEGDLVLGCRNRSIVSASYLLMKADNPSLAVQLWSEHTEEPFRWMCFTDKPHLGEVPVVSQMLRYLEQDCRDFKKLSSEKCDNIICDYGSFNVFVRLGLGYDFPFSFRHSE